MKRFAVIISILFSFLLPAGALTLTDFTATLTDIFSPFVNSEEGATSFRSLLIPPGGRSESLGGAYTGLSDDVSFMNYNPAASSVLKTTQASLFHNSWIADSSMETLSYSMRFNDFGVGAMFSCFYVPFTEYDFFGSRASSGYYSESVVAANASYNLFSGYNFKGLALGVTAKGALRGVPDFSDNDGTIVSGSGYSQSAIAVMVDAGAMIRFNFAKFYASRDPNVRIGLSVQNIGVGFTGFGSGLRLDDPLPSSASIGASYNIIKPVVITADIKQPFVLKKGVGYQPFQLGAGVEIKVTKFFSAMAGFQIKGANPRISAGAEFEVNKIRFNANYSLDFTTSTAPLNRISVSAKFVMGDGGREAKEKLIDELYNEGVLLFSKGDYTGAIEKWEEVLELDKRFDPAILGIQSANRILEMFQKIRESMFLD